MPLFAAITRFAETSARPGIDDQSEHLQGIQLREALDEAMPALIRAGVAHELRSSRDQRGAHLIQSLPADLDSLPGFHAGARYVNSSAPQRYNWSPATDGDNQCADAASVSDHLKKFCWSTSVTWVETSS